MPKCMDRRGFLRAAARWGMGLAALGAAGLAASCSGSGSTVLQEEEPRTLLPAQEREISPDQAQAKPAPALRAVVTERCVGCGKCTRGICPVGAISLSGGQAHIADSCTGCGSCVGFCPSKAIVLAPAA